MLLPNTASNKMKYTPAITVQQATGPFYFNGGAPWFDDPNEAQRWADTNAHCFMLPLKVLDQSTYYKEVTNMDALEIEGLKFRSLRDLQDAIQAAYRLRISFIDLILRILV